MVLDTETCSLRILEFKISVLKVSINIYFERELCMDTETEEEVSIGDESDKFPRHQEPSCSSEDSGDDEKVEPEGGTWQTRSNRNVCCAAIHRSATWSDSPKY
jgi:hypothetical protein